MLELGKFSKKLHLEVAKIVNKTGKPISIHCEDQLINEKNMNDLKNVDNPQIH